MVQLQKIAGAFLFALILVVGINVGGDALEHSLRPAAPHASSEAAAPAAQPAAVNTAALKKCTACHTVEQGGANRAGPNLFGILGRPVASVPGFNYSEALKGLGGAWTPERLDSFIANPKAVAPGTKMGFAGEPDATARAAMIDTLTTLK